MKNVQFKKLFQVLLFEVIENEMNLEDSAMRIDPPKKDLSKEWKDRKSWRDSDSYSDRANSYIKEDVDNIIKKLELLKNDDTNALKSIKDEIRNYALSDGGSFFSLKSLVHGISIQDANRDTKQLVSKIFPDFWYELITIKNDSELARLVQLYSIVNDKSIDFSNFWSLRKQIDGKIGRFTKQGIIDTQKEMNDELSWYKQIVSSALDQIESNLSLNWKKSINTTSALERFWDPKAIFFDKNTGDIIVNIPLDWFRDIKFNFWTWLLEYNWRTLPYRCNLSVWEDGKLNFLSEQNKKNIASAIQYAGVFASLDQEYIQTWKLKPNTNGLYFRKSNKYWIECNAWDSTLWISHNTEVISSSLIQRLSVDTFNRISSNPDLLDKTIELLNARAKAKNESTIQPGEKY